MYVRISSMCMFSTDSIDQLKRQQSITRVVQESLVGALCMNGRLITIVEATFSRYRRTRKMERTREEYSRLAITVCLPSCFLPLYSIPFYPHPHPYPVSCFRTLRSLRSMPAVPSQTWNADKGLWPCVVWHMHICPCEVYVDRFVYKHLHLCHRLCSFRVCSYNNNLILVIGRTKICCCVL